jgi:hypothetical protein
MGTLLLHNPRIQFYLLYFAAWFVACIWDYLRNPPAIQDDSRTPRNEVAHGAPGLLPSAASQTPPRSGLSSGDTILNFSELGMVSPELPGIETFLHCPQEGTRAMVLHADGNHFCSIATRGHYAGGQVK